MSGRWCKTALGKNEEKRKRRLVATRRTKKVLKALVVKLDRIFSSNEYLSVFSIAQVHHGPYRGENCVEEMDAAREVLKELE